MFPPLMAGLEAFSKELPENPQVARFLSRMKEIARRHAAARAITVGSVIHDFSAPDIDGHEFRLSDVFKQNKYVLMEFWASWCGPCRAEIPSMKEAYAEFHPQGFEIVSFSLDDKKIAWKKASDEERLPWVNTSDLQAWKSPVVQKFGVAGVPFNYLVDRNGTIVAMNLRREALKKKLAELL